MKTYLRKNCRLCKSNSIRKVFRHKSSPIGDDYRFKNYLKQKKYHLDLYLCANCKFVQVGFVIDPMKVYGDYIYVTKTSKGLKEHFFKFFLFLKNKNFFSRSSNILEIGSNDGTFQRFFEDYGCTTIGIDPAKKINNKTKLKNISDFFTFNLAKKIYKNKRQDFDLILANNVVANIDDLDDFFKGITHLLSPTGYFAMETFSLLGVLKGNLIDNIYHEHLSYFTIKPLIKYVKKFGLNLVYSEHNSIKGGSLRLIFSKSKKKIFETNIKKTIKSEIKEKIASVQRFKKFQRKNKINDKKLQKILKMVKNNKKPLFGFGASVGSTTLAYRYEILKAMNYIFDDESRRWNLRLPGSKIKVIKPKKINKNSYIFLFAWRYKKNILQKHYSKFKGKSFIIPLPSLKILKIK